MGVRENHDLEFELPVEHQSVDALNRVESLARVCKLLAQTTPRGIFETETVSEIESLPSPKKLKDDREISITLAARRCDMHVVSIGIYTRAERRAKLERYRAKKNRRTFNKKILYACRKSFADSRPRVGGRFVPLKDLPIAAAGSPRSPTQRVEQEFSELLASISQDLSQQTEPTNKHSPNFSGHSPPRLDTPASRGQTSDALFLSQEHSVRSYNPRPTSSATPCPASFCPQQSPAIDYSQQSSFSDLGFSGQMPPYLSLQQQSYYPNFPASAAQSVPSYGPPYPYNTPPSRQRCITPPRGPVQPSYVAQSGVLEDPSASLLLLSLASSTASRAEVF